VKVVAGGRVSGTPIETVSDKANRPDVQFLQVPASGKVEFQFLLSGKGPVVVDYRSVKAGKISKTIRLE